MSNFRITTKHVALLLALSTIIGCGNTGDGIQEDADNVAQATSELAQSTGDAVGGAVTGAMMTAQIKTAIVADERIRSGDIDVDTDDASHEVTLTGSVMTEAERTIAEDVAREKAEDYTIVNSLEIKP